MNKRIKYSLKQKLAAIIAVEKGNESIRSAASRLGCSPSNVRQWIGHYKQHGKAGLNLHIGTYSGDFKVDVVQHMLNNRLSLMKTSILFGIPNISTVYSWLKIYEDKGISALMHESRGRKKLSMGRKKQRIDTNLTTTEAQELAALKAEVEWLRAENALLKKLEALIQEEEARVQGGIQQKPSRN